MDNNAFDSSLEIALPADMEEKKLNNKEDLSQVPDVEISKEKDSLPCNGNGTFLVEIPKAQTQSSDSFFTHRNRRLFAVSYEACIWVVFVTVTAFCVADHFVYKGDMVLGRSGKLPQRIWGTNLGETITNVVWAVTARIIITSQNLMFYTTLWCFPNLICENSPKWLTIDGIRDVHLRVHTFTGIFLIAIPSLAHVLVIFLPPLIDGTKLQYYPPSTFNYSQYPGHMNWTKIWDPAAVTDWTFNDHNGVHLTADEIYRFVLMIVLFCFFFPLSRSYYANQRSYSLAIALHAFAGIWYSIDNIRKITHGLAHVFNLPMLILWCFDRLLSIVMYRHHRARIVQKQVIGNEYVVAYIKLDNDVKHAVGDVYYILQQMTGSSGIVPQRSHPFTTFSNLSNDRRWDIGLVVSIMEEKEQLCLPWTHWLASNEETCHFHTWGPYRSSVWKLYNQLQDVSEDQSHFVLFATGSGCGYLLDVLSILAYKGETLKTESKAIRVDIYYSVRCKAFYHFLRKPVDRLLKKIKEKNAATVNFKLYVTSEGQGGSEEEAGETSIEVINGRMSFENALKSTNKKSSCYFVGRPSIAEMCEQVCKKKGLTLVKDYTNGPNKRNDRQMFMKYVKISFWVICFIVAVCVVLRFVLDVESIKKSLKSHGFNGTT